MAGTTINTVKAVTERDDVLATGTFEGNGFTINLPVTVSAQYLTTFEDLQSRGLTISNAAANFVNVENVEGYNGTKRVGYFIHLGMYYERGKEGGGFTWEYIYVDRDVTITGTLTSGKSSGVAWTTKVKYDVLLKKGWNIIYYKSIAAGYVAGTEVPTLPPQLSALEQMWSFIEIPSIDDLW